MQIYALQHCRNKHINILTVSERSTIKSTYCSIHYILRRMFVYNCLIIFESSNLHKTLNSIFKKKKRQKKSQIRRNWQNQFLWKYRLTICCQKLLILTMKFLTLQSIIIIKIIYIIIIIILTFFNIMSWIELWFPHLERNPTVSLSPLVYQGIESKVLEPTSL